MHNVAAFPGCTRLASVCAPVARARAVSHYLIYIYNISPAHVKSRLLELLALARPMTRERVTSLLWLLSTRAAVLSPVRADVSSVDVFTHGEHPLCTCLRYNTSSDECVVCLTATGRFLQ
jgi:hypothetical protein